MSFPWLTDAVHLALTREALWSAYNTEVRRWPLSDIERIEPRADPVDDCGTPELADADVVRRWHRDAETSIRDRQRIALHRLGARPSWALAVLVGRTVLVGPDARTAERHHNWCVGRPRHLALRREPRPASVPGLV